MSTLFRPKRPAKKPTVGLTTEVDVVDYEKGLGEGAPGKQSVVFGTLRRIFPNRGKRKTGGFWSKVRTFFASRKKRVSINANEIQPAPAPSGEVVMPKGNSEAISSEGFMYVTPQNAPNVNFGHESIFGSAGPNKGESFTSFAPLAEQGMDQTKDGAKEDLKMILGPMLSSKSNPSTAIEETILVPTNLGVQKSENRVSDVPKRSSKDENMVRVKDAGSGKERDLKKDDGAPPVPPVRKRSKPKAEEIEITPPVAPRKVSKKKSKLEKVDEDAMGKPPKAPERQKANDPPPPPPSPGGKTEILIPPPPPVTNPSYVQMVVFSRTPTGGPTPPAKTPRRKNPETSAVPEVKPMASVSSEDQKALAETEKTPDIDMFLNENMPDKTPDIDMFLNKNKTEAVSKFQLVPKRSKQQEKLPEPVVHKEEDQAVPKPGSLGFGNIVGKLVRPKMTLANQQVAANGARHSEAATETEEDIEMLSLLQSGKYRDEKSRSKMSLSIESEKHRKGSKASLHSQAKNSSMGKEIRTERDEDVFNILKSSSYKNKDL